MKTNSRIDKDGVYRVIVIPDMQVPYHDRKALAAVEKYMADETWDEWLQMGDFIDHPALSRFSKGIPAQLVGKEVKAAYKAGNDILDRHQAVVRKNNPKAKFTLLAGNHDIRPEKFVEENPQLKGMIETEVGLRLAERGIKYVKCYPDGDVYRIGKAHFIHGLYTSSNHAKKHVDNFGVSVFYGHVHDIQMHSKVLWGTNSSIVGQSLGCLCRMDLDYIGNNPKNWQHAVTTFFFQPDGRFSYYVSRIFDGKFVAPNGKVYSAK